MLMVQTESRVQPAPVNNKLNLDLLLSEALDGLALDSPNIKKPVDEIL